MTGIHSDCIDRIESILRVGGVTVHRYASDLPCMGMYRSETKEVFLNTPDAFDALLTIAHEAGHWVGWTICPKKHSYQRERQAFVYGWKILQLVGAHVTRESWIEDERARRAAPDVDTSHVLSRLDQIYAGVMQI